MACIIFFALGKEGKADIKEIIRNDHPKHLASIGPKLLHFGALLDRDNKTIIGGVSIIDVENIE